MLHIGGGDRGRARVETRDREPAWAGQPGAHPYFPAVDPPPTPGTAHCGARLYFFHIYFFQNFNGYI